MVRALLSLLFSGLVSVAQAQWDVPHKVVLDGAQTSDRQVTGLALPAAPNDGTSSNADRNNAVNLAPTTGTLALSATLTPAPAAYVPGMRLVLLPAAANEDNATLNVNGLGAVPLRKNIVQPLDSGDLRPGIPVHVIHDGVAFQVTDQLYPGCPSGFAPISADVCIQTTSNDTMGWYAAVTHCADRGARLCGFTEWMQGCLKLPGFLGTVSDYEWVDSAANYNNMAKAMGWAEGATAPDCRIGSRQIPQANFRSRCCYDR